MKFKGISKFKIFLIVWCGIFLVLWAFDYVNKKNNPKEIGDAKVADQEIGTEKEQVKNPDDKPKTELQVLADQYFDDTDKIMKKFDLALRQDKDLKFIKPDRLFEGEIAAKHTKYPNLDCGDEEIRLAYVPDTSGDKEDALVVHENTLSFTAVDKKSNKVLEKKEGSNLQQLSRINFNNVEYYLTEEYTGGAHCCYKQRVISCQNGKVRIGDEVSYGDSGESGDLFIKNNQIYLSKEDSRFSYFYLSYALSGGMSFPAFYKLDTKKLKFINATNDFSSYYADIAKHQDEWLIKLRKNKPTYYDNAEELWFYPLIQRLTASFILGQSNEAMKENFMRDFNYFINSPLAEKNFLSPLTNADGERVFDDALKVLSQDGG